MLDGVTVPEALKQNQFGFWHWGAIRQKGYWLSVLMRARCRPTGWRRGKGLFGGMRGQPGGVAVLPDGSNLNPLAQKLLNFSGSPLTGA
jgi:hypothetical protein